MGKRRVCYAPIQYRSGAVRGGYPAILNGSQIQSATFPEPEKVLGEWLCSGFSAMVYGKTGIGKSWFAYSSALAIANGEPIFGWAAPEARRVIYFDAEIDAAEISGRLKSLCPGGIPDEFLLCAGMRIEGGLPQLDDEEGQQWYLDRIEEHEADVVIMDNLCSLVTSSSISEDETWLPVQPFLNELRRLKKAVVIVHHAGKKGDYLGSSRMTQNINTVIKLERPMTYDPQSGAVFDVEFEKGRSLHGDAAGGFSARLIEGPQGHLEWETSETVVDDRLETLVEAIKSEQHASQQEVADALGVAQSLVSRRINQAESKGLLIRGEAKELFGRARRRRKEDAPSKPLDEGLLPDNSDGEDEDF